MSTTYKPDEFSPSVLPPDIDKDMRHLAVDASGKGWDVEVGSGSRKTVYLIAPDGKRVKLNRGAPVRSLRQQVENHAVQHGTARNPDPVVVRRVPVENKHARQERTSAEAIEEIGRAEAARHIVFEGPMVARKSHGKGYPSQTTIERRWSDKTVDYACAFPGCGTTSQQRTGIRSHWAVHIRAGEVERMGPSHTGPTVEIPEWEPAYRKEYTPRADRVDALAAALQAAMEAGIDWADLPKAARVLAEEALQWAHEQSDDASGLAGEREPLTAEQILARVRNLLDNGEYLAQRREIETLREQVTTLEVTTAEAVKEAQRAHDTLRAFRDLAAEVE